LKKFVSCLLSTCIVASYFIAPSSSVAATTPTPSPGAAQIVLSTNIVACTTPSNLTATFDKTDDNIKSITVKWNVPEGDPSCQYDYQATSSAPPVTIQYGKEKYLGFWVVMGRKRFYCKLSDGTCSDGGTNISAMNMSMKVNSSSNVSEITLSDRRTGQKYSDYAGTQIGVQTSIIPPDQFGGDVGTKEASKAEWYSVSGTSDVNLGAAFSEKNIKNYTNQVADKYEEYIAAYVATNPNTKNDLVTDKDTDIANFRAIMETFKPGGDNVEPIKTLLSTGAATKDPFGEASVKDSSGNNQQIILTGAGSNGVLGLSEIYKKFFHTSDGTVSNITVDFSNLNAECRQLSTDTAYQNNIISAISTGLGTLAGGLLGLATGGTAGIVTVVGGAVVGDLLGKVVAGQNLTEAEKTLANLVREYTVLRYELLYLMDREVYIGLTEYQKNPSPWDRDFSTFKGFTPMTLRNINSRLEKISTEAVDCIQNFQTENATTDECGCSNTITSLADLGSLFPCIFCHIFKMVDEGLVWMQNWVVPLLLEQANNGHPSSPNQLAKVGAQAN